MLEAGTKAPEIVLNDKDGNEVKLSDFKGQRVVVYFIREIILRDVRVRHARLGMNLQNTRNSEFR